MLRFSQINPLIYNKVCAKTISFAFLPSETWRKAERFEQWYGKGENFNKYIFIQSINFYLIKNTFKASLNLPEKNKHARKVSHLDLCVKDIIETLKHYSMEYGQYLSPFQELDQVLEIRYRCGSKQILQILF